MAGRSRLDLEGMKARRPGFAVRALAVLSLVLLTSSLLSPATARAADTLEEWRREAKETRILAENDAPRAYEAAQRLQATLPADATPVDQAQVLNLLSRIEIYLAMTEAAANHARLASELAAQHGDRVGQAEADLNVALNAVNEGKIDDLIAVAPHSLEVLEGVDRPDLLGEALLRSAMTYRRLGQIDESVRTTMQAMEIARRSNDPLVLTYAYQGLGISFSQSDHYEQSRENFLEMREQARAAHSKNLEAYAVCGVASAYAGLGDFGKAEALIREAVEMFRTAQTPFGLGFSLFALADNLRFQEQYDRSLQILGEAIAIYEQHPNKIGLWYSLNLRSSDYLKTGNVVAALADAERAHELAREIGLSIYLSESAQRVATISAAAGDYHRAYQLSVEAAEMTAKAERQKISVRVVELGQRYEAESKQRQIDELTRSNEQKTAELHQRELQQRWLWTVLGASTIVLIGSTGFMLYLRRSQSLLETVNTQLQRSQGDLQHQTGILQSILDSMGDGVSVANERGELLLVNPAAEKILGMGLRPGDFSNWTGEYGLYLPDQMTPYPVTDLPLVRAVRGESCDNVEMFMRNPNLVEGRWLSVTACPLVDKAGIAQGGVAVFSDITARKHAAEEIRTLNISLEQRVQARTAELRQQTRYLRTLFDTLPLSVWLKDTASRYLAVNESCAEASGLKVEEMVGKSDLDLWPQERAEANRNDDIAVMGSGRRKTVEEPLAGTDATVWIETDKAPVLDEDGTVLGIVGIARNISERKAAEAAREAALAEAMRLAHLRSEFVAQMSHELRTPLNAILGYAQLLRRDVDLTNRQATGLATIQASGEHLLTLINDILDLSRIEAGKLELRPAEVDLAGFLRVVADIIRVKAEEKSLVFTHEAATDLPVAVWADDRRLRQVLLNLLGNAVKFTDSGTIVLRVALCEHAVSTGEPVARVRFEVTDSGIGMAAAQLERIFQPFEQVGAGPRREGGAGLGLTISRQLVRLMGGDIEVRSEIGEGSLFWFELDLPVIEGRVPDAAAVRAVIGYEGQRRRVLIVDDVPQNRAMLMDALSALGFEVFDAGDGQEGLDLAGRVRPDLIVMDITMPVMDGLEATRRIRATPALAQIPIISVTASATPADEARSRAAGADAFVPKPIAMNLLLRLIGKHLHLGWLYDHPSVESETAANGMADDPVPPREEMEALYRLALEGYIRPIKERADHLMTLDPSYQPFAARLMRLADGYQSKAILALIERHLK